MLHLFDILKFLNNICKSENIDISNDKLKQLGWFVEVDFDKGLQKLCEYTN